MIAYVLLVALIALAALVSITLAGRKIEDTYDKHVSKHITSIHISNSCTK